MTGFSSLNNKQTPVNDSLEKRKKSKTKTHMESKKFYIVLTSVFILAFFYFTSIGIMFLLPKSSPEFVAGFVTIFSKTIEILSVIIATYVGAQAVVDLKYGSSSSAALEGTTHTEKTENITVIHTNAKEDDYELI